MGYVRIKICGITRPDDASTAAVLGADAVGLNFYRLSPRYVNRATALGILSQLPPFVEAVGVFVNRSLTQMLHAVQSLDRLRTLQWHGDSPRREPHVAGPYRLIQAFPVRDEGSLEPITRYLDLCRTLEQLPDAVLLDAHAPAQFGGTGRTVPWHLLADFQPGLPVILAGGLTPENVAEAIRLVRPYAVDVASGVEFSPGQKDAVKLRRFVDAAREAAAKLP